MFDVKSSKKRFDANKVEILNYGFPYIVRMSTNNGIKGYINQDEQLLNQGNTIAFGQDTATMFYQENPYFTGDKIKILECKYDNFNKINSMFLISVMRKSFSTFSWGANSFSEKVINNQEIKLPTKDGKIDFEFMDACIRELEEERIRELSAYLTVSGLDNYELSSEEKEALDKFDSPLGEKLQNVQWGECRIGDLFEKLTLKFKKSTFNKATDISKTRTSEFNIPLINAKFGDNGIMYYGRKNDFETASMTIDIVNDGATSTASVYPQPQETGVLYNAYLIKPLFNVNNQILYFLSTTIQKSIKEKFGYENKAGWEKVKKESIQLPTKDGKIDFEFMELLISAVQKLVIKDVVLYADEKIQSTKKIVKES